MMQTHNMRVTLGLVAVPTVFIVGTVLWPSATLIARGLADLGSTPLPVRHIWEATLTTIGLAAGATVIALVTGVLAAWALYRKHVPGAAWWRAVFTVPFILPTIVVAAAFTALTRSLPLGVQEQLTWPTLMTALSFFNAAVAMRVVGIAWQRIPLRLEQAALTLGARPRQVFRHVTWPLLRPALTGAAATIFMFSATSFAIVLTLGRNQVRTLETQIWISINSFLDLPTAAVLTLLQILMLAAAGLLVRRFGVGPNLAATATDQLSSSTRSWRPLWALAPISVLTFVPLAALLRTSFQLRGSFTWDHYRSLFTTTSHQLGTNVYASLWNSLQASLLAVPLTVIVALCAATALRRLRKPGWLYALVLLPLGISAVAVGAGLLITWYGASLGAWRWGTPTLLIPLAQAAVAVPVAVAVLLPPMQQIPVRLLAAATTLGASPWRRWWHLELPLIRRPLGVSAALAFAMSLGEFGATAFLSNPTHLTLPTAIARLLSRPGAESLGTAYAAAVLLMFVTGLVTVLAESRFRRRI